MQGLLGKGGMDVTAGSRVLGAAGQAMDAGNFLGFSGQAGLGFMRNLASATMTGTPGGDMLRSQQVIAGMGTMQQMMSGQTDPLQQALNWSAAMKAAPGGGYAAHTALTDMDLATRSQILATGEVPTWMRDSGVTSEMVRSYVGAQTGTALARFTPGMGAGKELGEAVGRHKAAGGLGYLKDFQGNKGEELMRLARAISLTRGTTMGAEYGALHMQLAEAGMGPEVAGEGARQSASMDSVYGTGAKAGGILKGMKAKRFGELEKKLRSDLLTPIEFEEYERLRQESQGAAGGDSPEEAIKNVAQALDMFVKSLKNVGGGAYRAGAR
jgi:hypothetical protein